MMLYLTGANISLAENSEAPQPDSLKSLGGYVSSSPVPSASVNTLFDEISLTTIKRSRAECIAIALVNKLSTSVSNIKAKFVMEPEDIATFKIASVEIGNNLLMEKIDNRYSEPIQATFYDATFNRGAVDVEIKNPGSIGEQMSFEPFNIISDEIKDATYDGTFNAINSAFLKSTIYTTKRLDETKFRIEKINNDIIETPFVCSYIASDSAILEFSGEFKNDINNTVKLADSLSSGKAIGLWIQRDITNYTPPVNEKLIEDYDNQLIKDTLEKIELEIDYDINS